MASSQQPTAVLVPVVTSTHQPTSALISQAHYADLPITGWTCDWQSIWHHTDFDCQAIVKMTEGGNLWGLMRYSLYPYDPEDIPPKPKFLFIENVEAHPARRKSFMSRYTQKMSIPEPFINPVGRWLVWHACQIALDYCMVDEGTVLGLTATSDAVAYYRDIIGMPMKNVGLSQVGGDEYAFSFTRDEAQNFCDLQRTAFGNPKATFAS